MNYIYENHQQRLTNWNQTFLNPAKLEEYAQAISDRGEKLFWFHRWDSEANL